MAIEDVIATFESFTNPAEDATPDIDAVLSGVTEVYNRDISIRDNAVRDRERAIAELNAEKEKLMLDNYKLLMRQPGGNVNGDSGEHIPDESERAASVTFADIFKRN